MAIHSHNCPDCGADRRELPPDHFCCAEYRRLAEIEAARRDDQSARSNFRADQESRRALLKRLGIASRENPEHSGPVGELAVEPDLDSLFAFLRSLS